MDLIKNYMLDDILRCKLNKLTQKTFCFDFENWVTNGYFEGDYIPYSVYDGENILSNASANIMNFTQNGKQKNYIQIGTVMTDESYRRQGLARKLINTIIGDYNGKYDGIYLFGDLSAVDFYKKLGFKAVNEYAYKIKSSVISEINFKSSFKKLDPQDKYMRDKYLHYIRNCALSSAFEQTNKFSLQIFYTSELENVYYSKKLDSFIVADIENENVLLHSVLIQNNTLLKNIISELPSNTSSISLGYTPLEQDRNICDCIIFDGGVDYRLFILGNQLESIETDRLFFPTLSHA